SHALAGDDGGEVAHRLLVESPDTHATVRYFLVAFTGNCVRVIASGTGETRPGLNGEHFFGAPGHGLSDGLVDSGGAAEDLQGGGFRGGRRRCADACQGLELGG